MPFTILKKGKKLTGEILDELNYQFMRRLKKEGLVTLKELYIDGTKIEANANCFLASNFPHFHRYDSLKSALYIHAVSKNINTFPKNQGRIRAAIAVKILDFTVMYR